MDEEKKPQTPPPNDAPTDGSSPLPPRSRKRTNEEIYQPPPQSPTASSKAPRVQKSITIAVMPESDDQPAGNNLFQQLEETTLIQPTTEGRITSSSSLPQGTTFVKQINAYRQDLELDFQQFERSLDERDTSASLENMDWDTLEDHYNQEIQPLLKVEKDIMEEFNARFAQFMLYMQVCNDHEAERAVKRLRTRVALAQNSEEALAQKQAHHAKVLEAFQNAMALLGNV